MSRLVLVLLLLVWATLCVSLVSDWRALHAGEGESGEAAVVQGELPRIAGLRSALAVIRAEHTRTLDREYEVVALRQVLDRDAGSFLSPGDLSGRKQWVESLAASTGAAISDGSPAAPAVAAEAVLLAAPVHLDVRATLPQALDVIAHIEAKGVGLALRSISVRASAREDDGLHVRLDAEAVACDTDRLGAGRVPIPGAERLLERKPVRDRIAKFPPLDASPYVVPDFDPPPRDPFSPPPR